MFYIFVNTEAPLNGWNVYYLVTSKQTSKQDVLMDAGVCLIMDAHGFLDISAVTVLLALIFSDVLLILTHFWNQLFCAYTRRLHLLGTFHRKCPSSITRWGTHTSVAKSLCFSPQSN